MLESDLAPMVDALALPSPSFADIPAGNFNGTGATFPNSTGPGWVYWANDFARGACGRGCCAAASAWAGGANVTLGMPDDDRILNVAPLIGGQHALLGEQGKITAVSTYRFVSVGAADGGGIAVAMRGKAGEAITLMFATRDTSSGAFRCVAVGATVAADGTAAVTFKGAGAEQTRAGSRRNR